MIRGPHQSAEYVDQETSHADHEDAIEPGPHSIAHDEDNAMHRAIRRASCGQCYSCIGGEPVHAGTSWLTVGMTRMIVCPTCGNKRCPHSTHHDNSCTGSNEPGQDGSRYPAVDLTPDPRTPQERAAAFLAEIDEETA